MTFFSTGHNYFTDGVDTKYKEYTREEATNFLNANEHDLTDLYNIKQILLALGQVNNLLLLLLKYNLLNYELDKRSIDR
ncbi:hypothetical protein RMCBS344292_19459 [Rhizopus microsporus]|nr:hypothetical protein RMCBS344292_19459 [Rhizopus microsporus]